MRTQLYKLCLLLVIVAMTLSAPPASFAAAKTEVRIVWIGWPDDQIKAIFDAVSSKYPNLDLKVEALPLAQIVPALEVRLGARNELPDIYSVDGPLTSSYAVRGHLLEAGPVLGDDTKNFAKAALDQGTYKGKLWSFPYATSEILTYYNVDLLKAAGIAPPTLDTSKRWTWEQLADAGRKVANPDKGIWGVVIEQADRPYQILAMPESKGAKVLSDDGLKSKGYLDSPQFVEAIEFYQKLYTTWKISPVGVDSNVALEIFGQGKTGFFVGGTFSYNTLKSRYKDLNFSVAPHPYFAGGKSVTPTGSWHIGINPRSKHLQEAQDIVKFLTSDPHMIAFFKLRGYPPVKKTVYAALPDVFNTQMWKIVQYELNNTAVPRPTTPGYREYEDILLKALKDIQQGGAVKATLSKAADDIDNELAKYKQ